LKEQRQRLAELRLLQARQVLEKQRAEAAGVQERIRQTAEALGDRLGAAVPASFWIAHYHHAAQLEQLLRVAETKVDVARRAVEDAAKARTEIMKEVEALLYLRRQQWAEHREQLQAEEQVRLDEVSMRRWLTAEPAAPTRESP
jgi:flagellar biosynthesis chaperone FliJ